jgi:hypothetical protein
MQIIVQSDGFYETVAEKLLSFAQFVNVACRQVLSLQIFSSESKPVSLAMSRFPKKESFPLNIHVSKIATIQNASFR